MALESYPALDAWRDEVAAGERSPTQVDALQRAACAEATAVDLAAQFPELARAFHEDARAIVLRAVAEQRKRQRGPT